MRAFVVFFIACFTISTAVALSQAAVVSTVNSVRDIGHLEVYAENVDQPRLSLPNPTFDFGQVVEGSKVEAAFELKNDGGAPLEVKRIQPACGCTAAELDTDKIEPGDTTTLNVTFDTTGFSGYKVKTVRVFTNDRAQSSAVLTLKGTIQRDVEVNPSRLFFGTVTRGEDNKVSTSLVMDSSIKISDVVSRSEHLEVRSEDAKAGGKVGKKITVSLKDTVPIGLFRSRVVVKTSSESTPVVNIPVFASVEGDLKLSLTEASFGLLDGPLKEPVSKTVTITNRGDTPVAVESVSGNSDFVVAELKTIEENKKYEVTVSLKAGTSGTIRDRLKITTNHPDENQRELTLPVYGIVRAAE